MTEFHYNPALSQQLRSTANNLENDGLRRTANLIRQGADALDASVVTVKELRQEKSRQALDYLNVIDQLEALTVAYNRDVRADVAELRGLLRDCRDLVFLLSGEPIITGQLRDRINAALGEKHD